MHVCSGLKGEPAAGRDSLGHVLAANTTQSSYLYAMGARLEDIDSAALAGTALADNIAYLELPSLGGTLDATVPCSEAGFWSAFLRLRNIYE